MIAQIKRVKITVETDKGVIEKEFKSLADVVDFIGSLHPKAAEIAVEVKRFAKVASAMSQISDAMEDAKK